MRLNPADPPLSPDVRAVIERIPLLYSASELSLRQLEGVVNLNNANYRAVADGETYLLRVAADSARFLGVRRDEEEAAARAAAEAGVAPKVLHFSPEGHMVTRFVVGRHWTPEEFREPDPLARLAAALNRLHAVRSVTGLTASGSVYRRIERLLESARSLGAELPPSVERLEARLHRLEARRRADPRSGPCLFHHDLWANNFLDDGERLWLVDWEFAGLGDPLYDLATASMAGGLTDAEQRTLLSACGYDRPGDLELLQAMRLAVRFFEGAWALVMHALRGSAGFDYLACARQMLGALDASVEDEE